MPAHFVLDGPQGDETSGVAESSSFRNVSACNRCRQRKSRCDQRLPRCHACEKSGARCVGYDPITKREVPRSYLYYLETRVDYLKHVLVENRVQFKADSFGDEATRRGERPVDPANVADADEWAIEQASHHSGRKRKGSFTSSSITDSTRPGRSPSISPREAAPYGTSLDQDLVHCRNDPSCCTTHELIFGLRRIRPLSKPAELPDREQAAELVNLYFEHAYPQVPVLHKGDLLKLFDRAYSEDEDRNPRSLFFLYTVFAIGACMMPEHKAHALGDRTSPAIGSRKKRKISNQHHPAEEYHASATTHLQSAFNSCEDASSKLDTLQAAVLLAHLSLFYPVTPGPVYLVGLAMRAAVDMQLYDEESFDCIDNSGPASTKDEIDGCTNRLQDQCRRLWWSAYSLDRLIAPYTGRPSSVQDQIITMEVPFSLDEEGHEISAGDELSGKSKAMDFLTSHHFQLRLLQSEVHEVLHNHHAQHSRRKRSNSKCPPLYVKSPSSLLHDFDSIRSWKRDINRRLDEWKSCIPSRDEAGGTWLPVVHSELAYWQTINLLYRDEVSVPSELASMMPPRNSSHIHPNGDEAAVDDFTYFKIVEASRKMLQIYRLRHHVGSGNCTYLATHNIFLAGSLFLFTIWHSPLIRNLLTLEEIDCSILTGAAVLAGMADVYPQAEIFQESLERMHKATVQMCLSATNPEGGVKSPSDPAFRTVDPRSNSLPIATEQASESTELPRPSAPMLPQFDDNSKDMDNACDLDVENALTHLCSQSQGMQQLIPDDQGQYNTLVLGNPASDPPQPRAPSQGSSTCSVHTPDQAPEQYRARIDKTDPLMSLDYLDIEIMGQENAPSAADGNPGYMSDMAVACREVSNLGYGFQGLDERNMNDFLDTAVL
ncbi:Fungal specific transcription factor [Aspergillus nanangensis]|uniref:Fungal specific transcription factor n=1 Tax=Aspergillus nanangensis TaxID=2582783 RepID=A0AAD4CJ41_ASPNN|nr:Fungal specific transcription factor [Aspergillus nanangensis]